MVWDKLAIFLLTTSADPSTELPSERARATRSGRPPGGACGRHRRPAGPREPIDDAWERQCYFTQLHRFGPPARNGQDCTFIAQNGAKDTNQRGSNSVIRCALRLDNVA